MREESGLWRPVAILPEPGLIWSRGCCGGSVSLVAQQGSSHSRISVDIFWVLAKRIGFAFGERECEVFLLVNWLRPVAFL